MPAPAEMVWLLNPPRGTQITAGLTGPSTRTDRAST